TAVVIHLPHFFGQRKEALAVRNRLKARGGPAIDRFVVTVGDGQVHARIAVGRGTEDEVVFAETQTPGVVVARADKFQFGPVRLETINALPEANLFPAHRAPETRVADHAPDPVVETVAKITGCGVRVVHAPTREQHAVFVGSI